MTHEEALYRVKGYLTDIIPIEDYSEVEEIIKALEQQPCDDAISRQAVLELMADYDLSMGQVVKGIHALPPVTPQQNVGHWIFVDKAKEHAHCSNCGYGDIDLMDGKPHNYCQSCGAKMQER